MNTLQNHNYTQVSWKTEQEMQEIIMTVIVDLGFESFEQKDNTLYAYIPTDIFDENALQNVLKEYPILKNIPYGIKHIPAENWNAVWESNFTPVSLYPDVLIRAEYHNADEDAHYKHVILIQPKMAFGTGHHETTQMMLQAMQSLDFADKNVLDVGCGSGILSIYASFLGAKHITAIDIDTWCIENTQENAVLNKVKNIHAYLGDISTVTEKEYDIILANINRNVIISQVESYKSRLKSNGFLIVSGFLLTDKALVQEKAQNLRMNIIQEWQIKDWVCMVFQKIK
jgi:ribosomal protein L11 methyltransferase